MKSSFKDRILFAAVFSYSALLIVSSIPQTWIPQSASKAVGQVTNFQFASLRIVPGLGVFNFPERLNTFQTVSSCLEIEVKTRSGKIKNFEDFPCPMPKWRYSFYQSPLRIFYLNLANWGASATKTPKPQSPVVAALADYFCRKFDGESATIKFSTYYKDMIDRNLGFEPALPHTRDCAVLRPL